MKVFLNNKEICVGTRVTVMELLAGQNLHTSNVAVAVNNKVIQPGEEEVARNPRSRSAKLRIAEKI